MDLTSQVAGLRSEIGFRVASSCVKGVFEDTTKGTTDGTVVGARGAEKVLGVECSVVIGMLAFVVLGVINDLRTGTLA